MSWRMPAVLVHVTAISPTSRDFDIGQHIFEIYAEQHQACRTFTRPPRFYCRDRRRANTLGLWT